MTLLHQLATPDCCCCCWPLAAKLLLVLLAMVTLQWALGRPVPILGATTTTSHTVLTRSPPPSPACSVHRKLTGGFPSTSYSNARLLLLLLATRGEAAVGVAGNGEGPVGSGVVWPNSGSVGSWAGFCGRSFFVNFTRDLNMLLVAADSPPFCHVLCVNTDAMFSISCNTNQQVSCQFVLYDCNLPVLLVGASPCLCLVCGSPWEHTQHATYLQWLLMPMH